MPLQGQETKTPNVDISKEGIAALKKRPRLGMALQELEALWGDSKPNDGFAGLLWPDHEDTNKESRLYPVIKKDCRAVKWEFKNPDYTLIAALHNNTCIGIYVGYEFTSKEAMTMIKALLPNVKFGATPMDTKKSFGIYSISPKDKYRIEFIWRDGKKGKWFEIEDAGYIRKVVEGDNKEKVKKITDSL